MSERKRIIPERFANRNIYSISRLTTYNNCEYGYFLQYILKKKGVDNIYNVLGSTIHATLESAQFNGMSNKEMLQEFKDKVFELKTILGYKYPSEKVEKNFMESIEHYILNYKPIPCKEFKSELEFFVEINGFVLNGYIDGVVLHHDDTVSVIDYKTSSKYDKKDLDKYGLQLILYAVALEQLYGIKVHRVAWDMLKYCWIRFQGATKAREIFCQRNEIVKSLRNELIKDLIKLGYMEYEIELIINDAEAKNDMSKLPQQVVDKYSIEDGYVEYPLTSENKQRLIDFITDTITEIESKSTDESEWKPKELTQRTSFFCSTLCSQRPNCKYYREYLETLDGNKSDNDFLKNIFR